SQEPVVAEILKGLHTGRRLARNRRNAMILPKGVNKATGLARALRKFALSPRQVLAVGDAENDVRLLDACGYGVAVASAVPELKKHASLTTKSGTAKGVVELIEKLLESDFKLPSGPERGDIKKKRGSSQRRLARTRRRP